MPEHTQKASDNTAYDYHGQPVYAVQELIDDSYQTMLKRNSKAGYMTGHATGYVDLDHFLGGLQPGHLIVIAARPSMGKSALARNIAENLSVKKNTVATAIFSLEMSKEHLAMLLLSAAACVDSHRVRTGHLTHNDLKKLNTAKELLRQSRIYIDDTSGIGIAELATKIRRLKVDHDVQIIIIDYLQLMRNNSRSDLTQEDVSIISSSLKILARELAITILLLSQLHKSVEKRKKKRPRLSDLRNTGSLEDDADLILFLYRETVYCKNCCRRDGSCVHNHEREAELIIPKHKNGPIGSVILSYFAETMSFKDLR